MRPEKTLREGWPIVGWSAILIGAGVTATLVSSGTAEIGLRASIRTTAASSLLFFVAAFVASSACTLWPSKTSKWLLRNRRQLGVSFAVSQLMHLLLIALLVTRYGESFWRRVAVTTIGGGGLGYVFTAAMTLTSFDRTAAWLGRSRWKLLHRAGMYLTFGIFFFSYALLMPRAGKYVAFTLLLVAAASVRVAAWRKRRLRP